MNVTKPSQSGRCDGEVNRLTTFMRGNTDWLNQRYSENIEQHQFKEITEK